MSEEIHETPSTTPNFQTELAAQLAELMPEIIADGKVDVEKLKELLDGDAADSSERFGLFWPGKKRALRAAQEPTTATLRPDFENSKDWDTTKNVFIEGDNLEVLKILQKHYHAKIKMIYIDPPYNTGKDFVYPDNYKEGLDTYLEWTRQVNEEGKKLSTNAETEGRYHSNWLNMMYSRLKLARNLLTEDGVIFISIDDSEAPHLRKIVDEVFGERNFVAQFVWNSSTGGGIRAKYVNVSHQYVLCYVRNTDRAETFWAPLSPEAVSQYKLSDAKGLYRDKDFAWKNSSTNPNQIYPITAPDGQVIRPKRGYIYRFIESRFMSELEAGNITFKQTKTGPFVDEDGNQARWNIYVKKYLADGKGAPTTVIPRGLVGINNEGTSEVQGLFGARVFESPKNVRLLEYLLEIGADKSSIILDFFAGSSSTAHAVMALNARDDGDRKFIQVQLPEPTDSKSEARGKGFDDISSVSRARIDLAGQDLLKKRGELLDDAGDSLDVGFRAYKLADTSFTKWKQSSDVDLNQLEQHLLDLRDSSSADAASADDLLAEILLKQGYSLTEQIAPVDVAGLDLRSVGDGIVLAYLNEHVKPTLEQLRAVVDADPARLIVLEDAFQGDDQLKTNLAQLCKSKGIELWTA
ncbi:site-specific DNA-methyltransferase [Corynebacterium sp. AOP34-BR1-29]|uniref:site-specific DNA-methyltransferase n=1 Tax=Corynebacterium sp. AOP34-BR1-29 TaxID=3457688 RepID=UPI0040333990